MLEKVTYSDRLLAYTSHGYSCWYKGLLDEAEQYLLQADDYCNRINLYSWGSWVNIVLGEVYFYRGEYQKCQEFYSKSISLAERVRFRRSFTIYMELGLARAKMLNYEKDIDLESLYRHAAENKLKQFDGWISRDIAEILLNIDGRHMPEAEEWIKKAIEADTRNRTMMYLGWDYALYADLLKRKGDLPEAKNKLGNAIEIYRECGADGWLKKAQQDLAELQKAG